MSPNCCFILKTAAAFSEKPIGLKVKAYLKTGVVEHGETLARTETRRGTGRAKS
jgi:hypothetical protein